MEKGSKTLFSQRVREDLRGQLDAMRQSAWRLDGLGRSIDPLDGPRGSLTGAGAGHDASVPLATRSAAQVGRTGSEWKRPKAASESLVAHECERPAVADLLSGPKRHRSV